VQAIKGKLSADRRWPDCQQLAIKIFFHAATIYSLRDATKTPLKSLDGGVNFFDFASAAVIARSAFDTYLTMFDVFFAPNNEDEFEFNYIVWQLSGFIIRESKTSNPEMREGVNNSKQYIEELRTRIQATSKFNSLKPGEKNGILYKGDRKRDWKRIAKAAGFSDRAIIILRNYYSGYVHADGLSGLQIETAKSAKEQIELLEAHMLTMMVIMSKTIIIYAEKFEESMDVCKNAPGSLGLAQAYAKAINNLS